MRQMLDTHASAPGRNSIRHSSQGDSGVCVAGDRAHTLVALKAVVLVALVSCCSAGCVTQSSGAYDGAMTVTVENDTFTGSDNNYTNGIGGTWNSNEVGTYGAESSVAKWARFWSFLPYVSDDGYRTYTSWSIAQEMHTPDVIADSNPPKDDQPYAGVLYLDNVLYARKDRTTHAWALKVGVVGPASQAEDVQKWFHDVIGSDEPMGWDTQLPNEPLVNFAYSVAHLWAQGDVGKSTAKWRLVPVGTVGLGNYFTGVAGGMYGEVGWNLVDALGVPALRSGLNAASTVGVGPVSGWSVALYGGLGGYGVAHYLPLDGTLFHDSRSVDTKPFVGTGTVGIAVRHRGFLLSLARTHFTDMFETERKNAEFGTLNVSWFF